MIHLPSVFRPRLLIIHSPSFRKGTLVASKDHLKKRDSCWPSLSVRQNVYKPLLMWDSPVHHCPTNYFTKGPSVTFIADRNVWAAFTSQMAELCLFALHCLPWLFLPSEQHIFPTPSTFCFSFGSRNPHLSFSFPHQRSWELAALRKNKALKSPHLIHVPWLPVSVQDSISLG